MLLPSVENTSASTLNRQKKNATSDLMPASSTQAAINENQAKQTSQQPAVEKIDDKAAKQTKQPEPLQELAETTFSTDSNTSYPDFTVDLNSSLTSTSIPSAIELKPDEIRYGRKRPPLPISFSFGLRRPQAVAVAMRYQLLEGKQPVTAAQAILDTFDLAATNRLPYNKGTEISLVA